MKFRFQDGNMRMSKSQAKTLLNSFQNELPIAYIDFLYHSNGYLFPNSAIIYSSDEMTERNIYHQVNTYLESYVAIGEGDGDELFLMKKKKNATEVYVVDRYSIAISPLVVEKKYSNIEELCNCYVIEESDTTEHRCDIVISDIIDDKRLLLKIKREFEYDGEMSALLHGCKHPPFILRHNIEYDYADILLNHFSDRKDFITIKKI